MSSNHSHGSKTGIFIQDACYQHRYIRSRDLSAIVERPERLRAVKVGISAAISRLEGLSATVTKTDAHSQNTTSVEQNPDELAAALDKLQITSASSSNVADLSSESPVTNVVSVVYSSATVDILNHAAVKFIHGDIDGDVYLMNLANWIKESTEKIGRGESEIPQGLPQGDLYLCPGSLNALQGALGTICESVDHILGSSSSINRAFVAIRPPGHHCGEDTPSGFCFVNNVAVAAAHAHLKHGIQRIVIFDIDLHHGNGTQSIAWQINEETYRQTLESEEGGPNPEKLGPRVYYGSLHDVLSYPCEDGNATLIQAASVSIHGAHGQYIENIHLQPYESEKQFWDQLYPQVYVNVIRKAEDFIEKTGGAGDDVLVFISCGFDACEHEYESMSRHGRKVPTSFYHRFAQDALVFAEQYAKGRLISVLEGGYSDRALISGAMAHFVGLSEPSRQPSDVEGWWDAEELAKIEATTKKKRRGGRASLPTASETNAPYLARTLEILNALDPLGAVASTSSSRSAPLAISSMTLRERKKPASTSTSPLKQATSSGRKTATTKKVVNKVEEVHDESELDLEPSASANTSLVIPELSELSESEGAVSDVEDNLVSPSEDTGVEGKPLVDAKKLPRVILKLGPDPNASSVE